MKPECILLHGILQTLDRIISINLEDVCFKTDKEIKTILSNLSSDIPVNLTVCSSLNVTEIVESEHFPSIEGTFNSSGSVASSINFSEISRREDSCCNLEGNNVSGFTQNEIVEIQSVSNSLAGVNGHRDRNSGDSGVNFTDDEETERTKLKRGHSLVSGSGSSHHSECSKRQTEMISRKSKSGTDGKDKLYRSKVVDRAELEPLKPKESKSPGSQGRNDGRFNFKVDERQSLPPQSDAPVSMRDIDFTADFADISPSPVPSGKTFEYKNVVTVVSE